MKFQKFNFDKREITFTVTLDELQDLIDICGAVAETTYLQDIAALALSEDKVKETHRNLDQILEDAIQNVKASPQYPQEGTPENFGQVRKEVEWGPGGRHAIRDITHDETYLIGKIESYRFKVPRKLVPSDMGEHVIVFMTEKTEFEDSQAQPVDLAPMHRLVLVGEIRRQLLMHLRDKKGFRAE